MKFFQKNLILLTQPYAEKNSFSTQEMIELYKKELKHYDKQEFNFYIKEHPRELNDKYTLLIEEYHFNTIDKNSLPKNMHILNLYDLENIIKWIDINGKKI